MLQLLLKEQILTMAEYKAAEQRLASQQAQTATLQEDEQEEFARRGTLETVHSLLLLFALSAQRIECNK